MEITVTRKTRTANSTIGDVTINGTFFSHCLEPTDRHLASGMTLEQIKAIKVPNKTCIPTGRYQVTRYASPKHNNAFVPLLLHVTGFDYVEIHIGNYPKDTDACLLLGSTVDVDFVGGSTAVIQKFYPLVFAALDKNEPVWITYS